MLAAVEVLPAAIRFMTGAAVFSFMNVVAWRLPRGLPIAKGRSACPDCGAALTAADLVPVFGYLVLRGRCRHCGARIAPRYLAVEVLGGLLALGCGWRYGTTGTLTAGLFCLSWQALAALALCGVLLSVALIDAETQIIPDRLNLAAAVLGLVSLFLEEARGGLSAAPVLDRLLGAVCVAGPMLLLCLAIPGAFGGGDIKLMAAAGLFLGWQHTLLAAFLAILGGGTYGIWLLASRQAERKDHFAFGPFLCVGIAAAMLFGDVILSWYLSFFRL